MSLPSKLLILSCIALLSACGFQPLYAKRGGHDESKVFAGVKIDPIPGTAGQEFRNKLEDRLNPEGALPPVPAYRLNVKLKSSVVPIGVARDGTVSRYNVYLTSQYILYRISDDKAVTSGDIGFVDSYNNLTNAYFSTYISQEDAYKRGLVELSELYRSRLLAYLNEGAPQQKITVPNQGGVPTIVPSNPLLFNPTAPNATRYQ